VVSVPSESVVRDTKPASPADFADVDLGREIVCQFSVVDEHGIRSVRGPVCFVHESEGAVTVTVEDNTSGIFDFILQSEGQEYVLEAGIEARTYVAGYTVLEIDEVTTLELHEQTLDGGDPQ
jgi:hypothetical protein